MTALVNNVDINVGRRVYTIACPQGEEMRLRQLAGYLDDRLGKLSAHFATTNASVSEQKLLVMMSLMLVDELAESNSRLASMEEGVAAGGGLDRQETEHLTQRIRTLAERVTSIAEKVRI